MAHDFRDPDSVLSLLASATGVLKSTAVRIGSVVRLPARGRLVATGDLHDNPLHLQKIVTLARLDASPDHHVVLQEMIHGDRHVNGMDFSHRMLLRVAALICEYPGQVHPVLANHELAQFTGRGVSKGAGNSVEMFRQALDYVYGDRDKDVDAGIGSFIRAMPLALIGGADGAGVLCAHSLPGPRVMEHFDASVLERDLTDEDYERPHGAVHLMTWGRRYLEADVEKLAERWGVALFCLGHEHTDFGIEMRGPRVLILNSDHERATVLPIDLTEIPTAEEGLMGAMPLAAVGAM